MRVQPIDKIKSIGTGRIIPACAGTTEFDRIDDRLGEDHPRVCGYNFSQDDKAKGILGSSPRVRVQPT